MKVTAILPDDLVNEVRRIAEGRTITESLIRALREWINLKNIKELNYRVNGKPLKFKNGFTAHAVRELNRHR